MATTPTTETAREVRAVAKWVRMSPRKARLVANHIRGRTVPEARTVLAFSERAAAREIEKVLRSAVANAEANHDLVGDELVVSAAFVDEGVTIKRLRARARGRAARIHKPTCHITISLRSPAAAPSGSEGKRARRSAQTTPPASETDSAETADTPKRAARPKKEAQE